MNEQETRQITKLTLEYICALSNAEDRCEQLEDILREIVSYKYRECDCPNIGIYLELHGADSSVIERAKALLDDK